VTENTIYHGYRWMYVDRDQDATLLHHLLPTKPIRVQHSGYIAKLNQDKTHIVTVYVDRKTAALQNGHIAPSALDIPVKRFSMSNGFYYKLYEDCEETLKEAFVEQYGEPILYKNGIGQYDASTHELIKEFTCKYEAIKQMKLSDKTMAKALTQQMAYQGYLYKYLGCKTSMPL
jgi:hypothetical protein